MNELNNPLLEAALSYARKGYRVFPCKPRSKEPATKNGFYDATTDIDQVKAWYRENPNYNIGIRVGEVTGIFAADIDNKNGRHGSKTLDERGWSIAGTVAAKTPTGGAHGYYKWPGFPVKNRTGKGEIAPGVEVKGDGYVVAPPSVVEWTERHDVDTRGNKVRGTYEWINSPEDTEVAECPDWLLDELQRRPERRSADVSEPIPEGSRNDTLTSLAGTLAARGLPQNVIRETLHVVNINHTQTPLPADEVDGITIYENEELSLSPSPKGSDSDDSLPEVKRFKDMTPPTGPRPYIVDGVLFEGFAGAIYGDGGSAKSMLVMHMGQCVARGDKWLGFDTVKTNVLYLDFELDEDEQTRRAYQIAAGMGHTEPPEGFFYLSAAGYPTRTIFDHAMRICKEHGIEMVIVDSLGYALEGDAEASRDVLKFFREVEGAFRREGISLFIVDHQSKHGNYQDKTMFGSVYKTNSIRSVFQVEPGEHDDGYINLTVRHKKINFGPKLNPFGVQVTFDADKVVVKERELDATELVGESTLNAKDRVLISLADGPLFPADIAETTGLELGTVKNALTALRKKGGIENTGNKDSHGSNEVRIVSSLSLPLGDDDSYTLQAELTN